MNSWTNCSIGVYVWQSNIRLCESKVFSWSSKLQSNKCKLSLGARLFVDVPYNTLYLSKILPKWLRVWGQMNYY